MSNVIHIHKCQAIENSRSKLRNCPKKSSNSQKSTYKTFLNLLFSSHDFSSMSNFFKVVYIKELKEVEPVPCLWEEKGILYWPPTKKDVRQNQSNVNSIPNKQSWIKYTCVVKQSDILLFHHASSAADRICEDSSTEEEREDFQAQSKKRRISNKPSQKYDQNVYESYFDCKNSSTSKDSEIIQSVLVDTQDDDSGDIGDNGQNNNTIVASNSVGSVYDIVPNGQVSTEFEKLYVYLNKFEQNIDNKFAEIAAKLDYIDKRLRECEVPPEKDQDTNMLFPVNCVRDVQEFEQKLNIAEYKAKIFGHLRRVNGTGLFWKSACYKLCGFLFTKNLLTHYSWTGLSRTSAAKEPFNKLGNILGHSNKTADRPFQNGFLEAVDSTNHSFQRLILSCCVNCYFQILICVKGQGNHLEQLTDRWNVLYLNKNYLFYRVVQYSDNSFNYTQRDSFFRDGVLKHSITRLHGPKKKILVQEDHQENTSIEVRDEEQLEHTEENNDNDVV